MPYLKKIVYLIIMMDYITIIKINNKTILFTKKHYPFALIQKKFFQITIDYRPNNRISSN